MIILNIGFIGAGKVGTAMGIYLKEKNYNILGYYSRTYESAQNAAALTNCNAFIKLESLVKNSDLLFITTNDDEISKICNRLLDEDLINAEKIVVHMSGADSSKILEKLKKKGCYIYSLHPLQS